MLEKIITKIFGSKHQRDTKKIWPLVEEINRIYPGLSTLSDEQLTAKTEEFKKRLADGETLEDILPEAYATVKETCRRLVGKKWDVRGIQITWDMIPYDVQLIGG